MADAKRVIPPKTGGSHNPDGAKPRRTKDDKLLSELEREERLFKERRAAEKRASKSVRVSVRPAIYLAFLKLCEKFGREPPSQAALCFELGVEFFEQRNTPYGGPRVLDMLTEVREGDVMEGESVPVEIPAAMRARREAAGWVGDDLGLPVQRHPRFREDTRPAVVPIEEPPEDETTDIQTADDVGKQVAETEIEVEV